MRKRILSVALSVAMIACLILSIFLIKLNVQNETLKGDINTLIFEVERLRQAEETQELAPCYLCGGNAKIKPINDSFYIRCEDCDLQTDFFDSKSELVNYWNKNKESEE